MNLDELQSVQARERQSSDLQHLRSSFYREVGEYIDELTDRRSVLVDEADDPFSSPEVRQLSDDVETAEQTVEAIYERRVGKVVKKASIAAAGMPVDDDGLTEEEEALFEALVDRIERNRETVLSVLDGEPPSVPTDGDPEGDRDRDASPVDRPGGAVDADEAVATDDPAEDGGTAVGTDEGGDPDAVDAADLMGGRGDDEPGSGVAPDPRDPGTAADRDPEASPTGVPPDEAPPGASDEGASDRRREPTRDDGTTGGSKGSTAASTGTTPSESDDDRAGSADADIPGIPRTTVRITAEVGEVVGADNRDYDLGPEDVVTLPEANADVLVEKDAAERLE